MAAPKTKPKSKPRTKKVDAGEQRSDGYTSLIKGLGQLGRDPARHEFAAMPDVNDEQLEAIYRGDGVGARVVEFLPAEALRQGWGVRVDELTGDGADEADDGFDAPPVPGLDAIDPQLEPDGAPPAKVNAKPPSSADKSSDVDPAEQNAINDAMREYARRRKFSPRFREGSVLGSLFGGALLLGGFDDVGTNLDKMAEPRKPGSSLRWCIVVDRRSATIGPLDANPESDDFGEPASYQVTILNGTKLITVHASRVIRFRGRWAPARFGNTDTRSDPVRQGWDDPTLVRVVDALKHFGVVHEVVARVARDFSRAAYKIKGLHQLLAANREDLVRKRFELIELCQSVLNAVLLDADAEAFELLQRPVSGLPELMDRFGVLLAAQTGYPITQLLGLSPGGFGTGEDEDRRMTNLVLGYQDEYVRPGIERFCRWAFEDPKGPTKGIVPAHWTVTFPQPRAPSEKEKAEIRGLVAHAWAELVTAAVLLPEEAAEGMFGGADGFGMDVTLDRAAREEAKLAEEQRIEAETEAMLLAARNPAPLAPPRAGARPPVGAPPKPGAKPGKTPPPKGKPPTR